jgi:hypothetical protein
MKQVIALNGMYGINLTKGEAVTSLRLPAYHTATRDRLLSQTCCLYIVPITV